MRTGALCVPKWMSWLWKIASCLKKNNHLGKKAKSGVMNSNLTDSPLPLRLRYLTEFTESSEIVFLAWFFEKEKPGQQLSPAKRDDSQPANGLLETRIP